MRPNPNRPLPAYGTPEHAELQRIAANLVRNKVRYCVSSLVATLAAGSTEIDRRPFWEKPASVGAKRLHALAALCDQAAELCAPLDDWEEAATQAGWTESPEGWCWREPHEGEEADFYFLGSGPFVRAESVREACEADSLEPYPWQIFEHWVVSERLAEDLETLGERVDRDFAGMCVWGRATTGQVIDSDAALLRVAQRVQAAGASSETLGSLLGGF